MGSQIIAQDPTTPKCKTKSLGQQESPRGTDGWSVPPSVAGWSQPRVLSHITSRDGELGHSKTWTGNCTIHCWFTVGIGMGTQGTRTWHRGVPVQSQVYYPNWVLREIPGGELQAQSYLWSQGNMSNGKDGLTKGERSCVNYSLLISCSHN